MAERNTPTVDDLKAPLLAAIGAADLALERVNEIVAALRDRAEEARSDATTRAQETRERLTKAREDLPKRTEELRGRLTGEELRKAAESYREAATEMYQQLVERGEAALERLRNQPGFEESRARAEQALTGTVELTQEALGSVASQTRAVGERAAKLIGREPKKASAKKAEPAKKAVKKAPAKKAPAKKVTQK